MVTGQPLAACEVYGRSHSFTHLRAESRALLALLRVALRIAAIVVLALPPTFVLAQNSLTDVVGIPPDAAIYPIPGVGFVNLRNGNLHIEMPLRVVKDRNGTPLTTNLLYDSSVWQEIQVPAPSGPGTIPSWSGNPSNPCQGCFQSLQVLPSPFYQGNVTYTATADSGCQYATDYGNWQYTDSHGTIHPFSTSLVTVRGGANQCQVPALFGAATDGSGYFIQITNTTAATVWDMHGNLVLSTYTDVNGNHPVPGFSDMLGRSTALPSDLLPLIRMVILQLIQQQP